MKYKFIFTAVTCLTLGFVHAQSDTTVHQMDSTLAAQLQAPKPKKDIANRFANIDLSHRAIDHFMFQYGILGWSGATGSNALHGLSREFNAAFMLDKPFKSNPHYSLGFGLGYSGSSAFFNGKYVDIKSTSGTIFPATTNITGSSNSFKKFKIALNYVEIPLELRFSNNIANPSKGFRLAVGLKGGLLLNAHSKGKNEIDPSSGASVYGPAYIEKQFSKRYFNTTRVDGTLRASLGMFTLYGTYQLTQLLSNGAGPVIHPYSVGLGISIM